MTCYTVQELALQYAERLVEYHQAQNSNWTDKHRQQRLAQHELYMAQNRLNEACEQEALRQLA